MNTPDAPGLPARSPRIDLLIAASLAIGVMGVLLATSRDYAMVWDEGHTVRRERVLQAWFAWLGGGIGPGDRSELFSDRAMAAYWPFAREEPDGHPPFYALLGLAGWAVSRDVVQPLTSYRVGPMGLAALTVGLVYLHLARLRGRLAGLVGGLGMVAIPPCFSLAHYAHYDMPLSCLWVLSQIAFWNSLRSWRWAVPFGILLGLAAGTKFPGVFAVAGPLGWAILFEWLPRIRLNPAHSPGAASPGMRGTGVVVLGLIVTALTLYAINPPWWNHPVEGVRRFVVSNLTRNRTIPIPTFYLGRPYPFSLPWHNTIVYTAITVPIGLLMLGGIGGVGSIRSRPVDREGVLWILSWGVLMIIRALPNAPGHDGIRLFLPSILSLCVLSGIGMGAASRWLRNHRAGWAAGIIAAAVLGEGIFGIVRLYPYTLSYYNAAIGGLPGAERIGMEVTSYYDTMGGEFFGWVHEERRKRPLTLRFPTELINIKYLREWGEIPDDVPILPIHQPEGDYVVQRRRGVFYPYDWWLEKHGTPEFVIRRQGVDLLRVYSFPESLRAFGATRGEPLPSHLRE